MAAERLKRVVKKPKRFVWEFSRSIELKKTDAREGDKKLYDVEVTEVEKVNKRIKINFCGAIARNLTSGDFSVATRDPTISSYSQKPFPETNLFPIQANFIPN